MNNLDNLTFKAETYKNGRIDERNDLIKYLDKLIVVCKNSKNRKFLYDFKESIKKGQHVNLEDLTTRGIAGLINELFK